MTTHQHTSGAELLPWNRVVTPHIDIVQGQLSMDTYAANLGKVVQGRVIAVCARSTATPMPSLRRPILQLNSATS